MIEYNRLIFINAVKLASLNSIQTIKFLNHVVTILNFNINNSIWINTFQSLLFDKKWSASGLNLYYQAGMDLNSRNDRIAQNNWQIFLQ